MFAMRAEVGSRGSRLGLVTGQPCVTRVGPAARGPGSLPVLPKPASLQRPAGLAFVAWEVFQEQ